MEIVVGIAAFLGGLVVAFLALKGKLNALQHTANQAAVTQGVLEGQAHQKATEMEQLKALLREAQTETLELTNALTKTETDYEHLKQRLQEQGRELEQLREKFLQQFQSISNQVLMNNAEHFNKASSEHLERILTPLKERIKEFEAKVDQTYEKTLKDSISLKEQITQLASLNQQMSQDALNLTRALKGENKTQGNWGEYLLESLLEKSGLRKGVHFEREEVRQNDDSKTYRPDVIVRLPDSKHLIIDSKMSLVAYEAYCSCEDENQQEVYLRSHINSVRTHFSDLGRKNYHRLNGINSPDFVLMYIPIEPAFNLAIQHDHDLFTDAFDRNIVLVTTSTLLATLRTVAGVWRQEDQKRNVLKIAEESGKLYDKFVGFVEDLKTIGKHIENSQSSYNSAMNKLTEGKGNLIRRVEILRELGAKTSKTLDDNLLQEAQVEELPQ
ncbi:DNA recombination protein RmuC [Pontibacter ummariensis]|uniref:DNA recombination protein RmuC n=1 Tax=Pontibacter ummariensis TaxID=1610492 RepID=A0A239FQX1_9BACT|nr:DNA recombination protein RmuC [Pontibacter ummariensis]PRY11959.1 DNA recombination protein RmuC [Pontibacter ummariensis]SNS59337.1 DNA recombination protein RmuC [Pontibacter ummariensis]